MIKALCSHWYQQKNAMKQAGGFTSSQWKDPKKIRDAFYYVVHRLWLASCAKNAQVSERALMKTRVVKRGIPRNGYRHNGYIHY